MFCSNLAVHFILFGLDHVTFSLYFCLNLLYSVVVAAYVHIVFCEELKSYEKQGMESASCLTDCAPKPRTRIIQLMDESDGDINDQSADLSCVEVCVCVCS